MHERCFWSYSSPKMEKGIIVASDSNQEWLLPWWWERYRNHNRHPVAFIDFGMSPDMLDWCSQRGDLIALRELGCFVKDFQDLGNNPALFAMLRETEFGKLFWNFRQAWFKKPFACLETPFLKTIWIDLDCDIRGPLDPLFGYKSLAMAIEKKKEYPIYNSGVIAYQLHEPIIAHWAERSLHCNEAFRSDQDLFSFLVAKEGLSILELPPIYNWTNPDVHGETANAVVLHWYGVPGKRFIRQQIAALSRTDPLHCIN